MSLTFNHSLRNRVTIFQTFCSLHIYSVFLSAGHEIFQLLIVIGFFFYFTVTRNICKFTIYFILPNGIVSLEGDRTIRKLCDLLSFSFVWTTLEHLFFLLEKEIGILMSIVTAREQWTSKETSNALWHTSSKLWECWKIYQ